jgi:hypothetical protein
MSSVARDDLPRLPTLGRDQLPSFATIAVWLLGSSIAVFFALLPSESIVLGDMYLPAGNDSFYHARRILDAAVGTRGFYQFDERLQVPDGAWISWPWAYDYMMAKATQLALWLAPSLDPMAFLAYVPVAWIFVNAALFMAGATAVGLSREMRALAMFCFAFSPLTQLLHSIGMVDHHDVEHTFVLLNAWLGILWFKQPDNAHRAAALGVALGAATAFHNGLFILQLFPLLTVIILWIRGSAPSPAALRQFAIALVTTTLLVLLPSEPFRQGMFEFGLHSWFHLYIAGCTATTLGFMAWRAATPSTIGGLAALSVLLALPLGTQLASGAGFLSGSFSILDQIIEVRSPYRMFTETMGPIATAGYYSWLLLLAPALLAFYAYRLVRERRPERVFFGVVVTLGLVLLLDQMRLHHFGYFGLVTGALLLLDEQRARLAWHRGAVFVAAFAVLALAFQPALRERLFIRYAPAGDPEYASALSLFLELGALCKDDRGTVLASSDDGNPILFHSDCGVIANNFILRAQDSAHIDEVDRLMRMTPEQIRAARPDVKYLLVRARDFSVIQDDVAYLADGSPIARQLFLDANAPPGYTLLKTVRVRLEDEGPAGIYAKLFRVGE